MPTMRGNIVMTSPLSFDHDGSVDSDLIEFTELLFAVLGYDITFEEFSKMTKEQRKSILRDIKINRVLKED